MSSGSPPTEGMLAKGGLRYLRNETEDMSEGNFFGRKVERVSISSGTARAGSILATPVITRQTMCLLAAMVGCGSK